MSTPWTAAGRALLYAIDAVGNFDLTIAANSIVAIEAEAAGDSEAVRLLRELVKPRLANFEEGTVVRSVAFEQVRAYLAAIEEKK